MSSTLTTGAPWRVILAFSIPLLIGNVVQQLYQFVDTVVVGRHLGVDALAAVGATGSLIFLLIGFALGVTSGFAIPTAQAYGAGDHTAVRRSVATGTILTAAMSVVLTIAAPLLAHPILILMQTPAELLDDATVFAQVSFLGSAATMFFNYLAAIIRAIGDSRTPLIFLILACLLNIALVIVMVGPLGWGVAGAALATVVSQAVSVLLTLEYVRRRLPVLHVGRADFRVARAELVEHLRLGLPMGFQASIISLGIIAVQVRLNSLGAEAVAAYTAASRIDSLASAFLASLGLAVSMYVAQNFGGGRPDRIRRGVGQAIWMSIIGSAFLGVLMVVIGAPVVRVFVGNDAEGVVDLAHTMLIINGVTYWILGVLFVTRGALQGLGRTLVPTITGAVELGMRTLAAIALGAFFGFVGVAWSNPVAWIGAVVILIPAYVRAHRQLAHMPVNPRVLTDTTPIALIGPHEGSDAVDTVITTSITLPQTGAITVRKGRKSRRAK
ncbi:MATE family efflux transporter [Microbacterium nanhaiense]|uniref:MATE family efflux transporter n=1 Tax=Microbacterium nanhaiense TaxID=1301026 RepID=A0ABQ2N076_9MICO|nr:MATE family efflux transporter [Microbacterium nanhaiense]GGO61906.1 MATE family efflux transporter [Microbacterium nanhaiense]